MRNNTDFNLNFDQFISSTDVKKQREAIIKLLLQVGLDKEFHSSMEAGTQRIKDFFLSFQRAAQDESLPKQERAAMVKMGKLSKLSIKNGQYAKLADMVFSLVFRHVIDFMKLSEDKDFGYLTMHDLYHKQLLPPEIFFQFFLLETLANSKIYNWKRDQVIIDQSLICLEVCFVDIYKFLHHAEAIDQSRELPRIDPLEEASFRRAINEGIRNSHHSDYLSNLLKEYEDYIHFFKQALTDKNQPQAVYLFQVTYLKEKQVWQEVAILGNQTFTDLAETIIEAMGWENDHMYGFSFLAYSPYTFFAPDWDSDQHPIFTSDQMMICHVDYKHHPRLQFEFDFGDSHLFEVSLQKIRPTRRNETFRIFPKVLRKSGRTPKQYPEIRIAGLQTEVRLSRKK